MDNIKPKLNLVNRLKTKLAPINSKLKTKLAPMMNDKNDPRKNDVWRILLFAFNRMSAMAVAMLLGRWAYFTQNVLQLGVFLAAVIVPMRFLDAVTDPIIANWFDRFESKKYGKYRPIMLIGAILSFIPALVIFLYPVNPSNIPLALTFTILIAMYATLVIGNTILMTVTRAGQAIITQAPEQRPVYAIGVTICDAILMGFVAIVIDSDLFGSIQDPFVWRVSIIIMSIFSLILVVIAMQAIKTRDTPKYYSYVTNQKKIKISEFFKVIKRSNPIKRLLWATCSDAFAASARNIFSIYLFANIIMQRSLIAPVNLTAGIVIGAPAIMIGVYLASQRGSAEIYTKMSLIQTLVALTGFVSVLILLPADPSYTYTGFTFTVLIVCLLFGLYVNTLGITWSLNNSMMGDLADYEYSVSGRFIPGTIASTLTFMQKVVDSAAGILVVGIMVFAGFSGIGKEAVVEENVFINNRFYYSILGSVFLLPAIGHFITYLAMRNYPITKEVINKISLTMAEERRLKGTEERTTIKEENIMKEIKVAYIGGGSKNWAQNYFADLLSQDKLCGEIRLYDIDEGSAEFNKKYFDKMVSDNKDTIKSKWECVVVSDIDKALSGADVVLISILPYSLNHMKNDVHYPEKYGIYQSVGDTTGPGGYSRALRTLGSFRFFAEKIRENCKDAWVINYTNPMAMCLNMLYREFKEIKAFGCCHEVFGLQKLVAKVMGLYNSLSDKGKEAFLNGDLSIVKKECKKQGKKFENIHMWEGINRKDIIVNVLGINHFTVVDTMRYQENEIMDIYKAYIKLFRLNNKNRLGKMVPSLLKWYRNKENVKFEVLEQYGVAGAAGDRHLAEFLPHKYLPLNQRNVLPFGFWLTPVWLRIYKGKKRKKKLSNGLNPKQKITINKSGEEGVSQLTALFGLKDLITNVNMLNVGQAAFLPLGATVETNAKFSQEKIEPVNCGVIENKELIQMEYLHAINQKEFVEAYYNHDKQGLLKVFLRDPSVARLGNENGEKLFYELIEVNKDALEDWLLN